MPSIFIWKATEPTTSKKQIRYYSGSNWFLEDNDYSSKSYMFLDQIVLTEFDNSVITYRAKRMPNDWVGSELLEVTQVPYEHIKSDGYGTLERIGNWMRFIGRGESEYDEKSLTCEYTMIKSWMNTHERVKEKKRDGEQDRGQRVPQRQQHRMQQPVQGVHHNNLHHKPSDHYHKRHNHNAPKIVA